MFIADIFNDIKSAIELRKQENKSKELSLKLLKEFKSLDGLKKWFDQVSYAVRPNGVFYETKIEQIYITIDPKKKNVQITGQMDDGSYLKQTHRVKREDIQEIAEEIAKNSLDKLKEERDYLTSELSKVNNTIASTEERLHNKEFSSEIETAAEKEQKKEAKKKMKKLVSKAKKK